MTKIGNILYCSVAALLATYAAAAECRLLARKLMNALHKANWAPFL